MNGMKINAALIFAMALQACALVWFLSQQNLKIDTLYTEFEEQNKKEVIENQVKMKIDLENLMQDVKQIKKDLRQSNKKDKEIMDQHKQLFNLLNSSTDMMQQSETKGSSYSYGD
jgi:flagellar biosynthesis/type III secretory pathway chaperone